MYYRKVEEIVLCIKLCKWCFLWRHPHKFDQVKCDFAAKKWLIYKIKKITVKQ